MKQTKQKRICDSLLAKYKEIRNAHDDCLTQKSASVILGPSIMRVFKKNTKKRVEKTLQKINIDDVKKILKSRIRFKKWFIAKSSKVNKVLQQTNMDSGSKRWAHATKITSLYLRDLLYHCNKKLTRREYNCAERMFYVPLDKVVLKELNKLCKKCDCGVKIPKKMSELTEKKQFFHIQDCLHYHASRKGIPAIWFDDIWVTDR